MAEEIKYLCLLAKNHKMRMSKTPNCNADPGFYFDFLFSLEGWGEEGAFLILPNLPSPLSLDVVLWERCCEPSVLGAIFLMINTV